MADIALVGYEGVEDNLGMRSLAAFLESHGISTRIFSCEEYDCDRLAALIRSEHPRLIGFSLIFQGYFSRFAQLIRDLRRKGVQGHFTMGGHFPSLDPVICLQKISGLDTIVRGEGELTLLELLRSLDEPETWDGIRGLAYRAGRRVILTPSRPLIANLDSLPFPLRRSRFDRFRGIGICPILSSRGCYANCAFCSIQSFYRACPGARRRTRSPEHVADEMLSLFEDHNVRVFSFRDDDLCTRGRIQHEWIGGFIRALRHRQLDTRIFWRISCRIDEVDREILGRLMEVGLGVVYLGIESGNEESLRILNKHYSVADIHRAVDTLVDIGLPFEYGFMMFDPSSTLPSLRSNLEMITSICRKGNVPIQFTKMAPYAGTPIAESLRRAHRLIGTIDSPGYGYRDMRVTLLESAFGRYFASPEDGKFKKADQLHREKFLVLLRRKFFPNEPVTERELRKVASRMAAYNEMVASEAMDILDAIEGFGCLPASLIEGIRQSAPARRSTKSFVT
jgi:anaerobic magnesium-protoporphyrin IX monomethyl ester cyclase